MFLNNPDIWEITLLSFKVSGLATLISLLIGLPFGTLLALGKSPTGHFLNLGQHRAWLCPSSCRAGCRQ